MKYVLTGGAGNITSPLAAALLKAGHSVTVIGRTAAHLEPLKAIGAEIQTGSVEDIAFLRSVFAGADAVYTMVPPKFDISGNWKNYIGQIGKNYRDALKGSSVKYVVNLSSVGAHLPDGCGPVSGLYQAEQALNELQDVHILHLRPSYFYNNLLATIPMIKHLNITGSNFGGPDFKLVLTATSDIAAAASRSLQELSFSGHSVLYIASDERKTDEIASLLGQAIGKPGLPWITFKDEDSLAGMLQAGLNEEIAKNYTEMGHALQNGSMQEDYFNNEHYQGTVKLEDFVPVFTAAYNA